MLRLLSELFNIVRLFIYSTRDIGLVRIILKMDLLVMIYVGQMFPTFDLATVMKLM